MFLILEDCVLVLFEHFRSNTSFHRNCQTLTEIQHDINNSPDPYQLSIHHPDFLLKASHYLTNLLFRLLSKPLTTGVLLTSSPCKVLTSMISFCGTSPAVVTNPSLIIYANSSYHTKNFSLKQHIV